jgi:Tol biopolymer transport system component
MNKRILLILGGLLLLIAVTIGFISYLQQRGENIGSGNEQQEENNESSGSSDDKNDPENGDDTPSFKNPQLTKVTTGAAIAPALSFDGRSIWFFSTDGKLFKQSLGSGLRQEYVLPTKIEITSAIWPLIGSDFIVESSAGGNKNINYYDSEGKVYIPYPSNIKHVAFMPDGRRVIYNWVENNGRSTLSTADYDTKNFKTIVTLPQSDQVVKMAPSGNRVFTYRRSSEEDGYLNYIPMDNPKVIWIKTGLTNRAIWSPDGKKFLFNKLDTNNEQKDRKLWLGDITNATDQPLDLEGNPENAAFDSEQKFLYLAVPGQNGDSLWKVNLSSFEKREIFRSNEQEKVQATDLLVTDDGSQLYFKNSDGLIYSIPVN